MQGNHKAVTLLLVSLIVNVYVNGLSHHKITRMAQILCPGGETRICPTNSSHHGMGQSDSKNCCMDCSCDSSCTEYGNCCFPENDYATENRPSYIDNVKILSGNDTTAVNECLYALSPQPKHAFKIQHQSFWMISEIKHQERLSKTQKCGLINVAPWGSLLPVSSRKTGHIYKNIFCAKEHLVKDEDVVNWEAAYICDLEEIIFELTESFIRSCQVKFKTPRGIQVRRENFCYQSLIDTCPEKDFNIPNDVTMNHTEVIDACTSGFVSPYRVVDMYANIFCHICNGNNKAPLYKCKIISTAFDERIGKQITGLIDPKMLILENDELKKLPEAKMACLNKDVEIKSDADRCRPLFCPLGQTLDSHGRCYYAVSNLINVVFYVTIELKTEGSFLNIDLFQHIRDHIGNFKSPLLKSFKITRILYKPHKFLNITNELFMYLSRQSDRVRIQKVVNFVKENVNKKWLLNANNSTFTLSSSLSSSSSAPKIFKEVFRNRIMSITDGMVLPLTKLYFCENVRLEPNEFNISSQNIVFDKLSSRYLYNHEYSLTMSEGRNATCNICIDGSSFHLMGKNSSVDNSNCLGAFYIVICVVVRVLMN